MGLFDSINSIFGSSASQKAAEQAAAANAAALRTYGVTANSLYDQSRTSSLGTLGQGHENALNALSGGLTNQVNALTSANHNAIGPGQAGVAAWDPLRTAVEGYDPAIQAYSGALGLRGPQDQAATTSMFRSQP